MKVRVGEEADSSGDRAKGGKADSPGEEKERKIGRLTQLIEVREGGNADSL